MYSDGPFDGQNGCILSKSSITLKTHLHTANAMRLQNRSDIAVVGCKRALSTMINFDGDGKCERAESFLQTNNFTHPSYLQLHRVKISTIQGRLTQKSSVQRSNNSILATSWQYLPPYSLVPLPSLVLSISVHREDPIHDVLGPVGRRPLLSRETETHPSFRYWGRGRGMVGKPSTARFSCREIGFKEARVIWDKVIRCEKYFFQTLSGQYLID